MNKHAYLIMAHGSWDELVHTISLIDDPRNDVYIHIDAKCTNFPKNSIINAAEHSSIYFTDRISVSWGGFSEIQCEMILFKAAAKTAHYSYYHLLSGVDTPVKSQDYIHNYFNQHQGLNFINFQEYDKEFSHSQLELRYRQYHFLQDRFIGKKRNFAKYVDFASCYIQRLVGIKRSKGRIFHKSWQWVSLTDECVRFLLSREEDIQKTYRFTYCCDEVFIISEIWNTPLQETIAPQGNLRFAEWKQFSKHDISPRAIDMGDLHRLESPDILFARKYIIPDSVAVMQQLEQMWQ